MPRNNGKGGKNYKRSKNSSFGHDKRQLEYKEDGQEYARITKMLDASVSATMGEQDWVLLEEL